MGAFAWQLCCRAHARAYYDHAVFDHHAPIVTARRNVRQLDACAATIRIIAAISRLSANHPTADAKTEEADYLPSRPREW
jgi:hypothetical protein